MWTELIDEVRQQQAAMDMLSAAWISDYTAGGGRIHCGRGCRGCCSLAVSTTMTEAVAIAGALSEAQAEAVWQQVERLRKKIGPVQDIKGYLRMHRQEIGFCSLLAEDGACGIYSLRPLSCRALLSTKESRWCGVDFSQVSAEEKRAFVESLDRSVVSFPLHYVASTQEMGQEMESRASRRMADCCGFSLYGSLPVLVHLVLEYGLDRACADGHGAAVKCIEWSGLNNPFLLHLEF